MIRNRLRRSFGPRYSTLANDASSPATKTGNRPISHTQVATLDPTLSSIQVLINGPSTSATTTSTTAPAAQTAISTETALARKKPRVSSNSYAVFSDHITVCIARLSDHTASAAPTTIIGPPCWEASTCFRL